MKLSSSRFTIILLSHSILLMIDMILNCVTLFPRTHNSLIVIFIFQDVFLILAMALMLMTFFSTYLFQLLLGYFRRGLGFPTQAGLMEMLFEKFRSLMVSSVIYLVSCIILHVYWLVEKWETSLEPSSVLLTLLFVLQRSFAPWYYYFYKRAALRISDPRFYEDIDWINQQLASK